MQAFYNQIRRRRRHHWHLFIKYEKLEKEWERWLARCMATNKLTYESVICTNVIQYACSPLSFMYTLMCNTLLDVITYRKCSLFILLFLLYVVFICRIGRFCELCVFFSVIFYSLGFSYSMLWLLPRFVSCVRSKWRHQLIYGFLSLAFGVRER